MLYNKYIKISFKQYIRENKMKNSVKLKIWGICQLLFGVVLMVLGGTVFRDRSWDGFAWKPNFALFVPGMFLAFLSITIILKGFAPQIAKFGSQLHSETMDYAGKDIKQAISKSADTIVPAVTPSIKTAFSELNISQKNIEMPSKKEQLMEAKKLFDDHLINENEYKSMREKILGIDE